MKYLDEEQEGFNFIDEFRKGDEYHLNMVKTDDNGNITKAVWGE